MNSRHCKSGVVTQLLHNTRRFITNAYTHDAFIPYVIRKYVVVMSMKAARIHFVECISAATYRFHTCIIALDSNKAGSINWLAMILRLNLRDFQR